MVPTTAVRRVRWGRGLEDRSPDGGRTGVKASLISLMSWRSLLSLSSISWTVRTRVSSTVFRRLSSWRSLRSRALHRRIAFPPLERVYPCSPPLLDTGHLDQHHCLEHQDPARRRTLPDPRCRVSIVFLSAHPVPRSGGLLFSLTASPMKPMVMAMRAAM